jgi:hypothetical protein
METDLLAWMLIKCGMGLKWQRGALHRNSRLAIMLAEKENNQLQRD